jgi:nitroreductase
MLDKGLVMRPRRATFGTDYIEATVRRLEAAHASDLMDDEMTAWARDVLDSYFEATKTSPSPQIARSRKRYERLTLSSSIAYSGPSPVAVYKRPVSIDALGQLARARRSVRWFLPTPVERSILDHAISIALEAPSACNRVPYRMHIFDNPDDATRVAKLAGGTGGYAEDLVGIIAIVGDLSAFLHPRDRHLIYIDGSLSAMSLILALESAGVSTCCINLPDLRASDRAIRATLGLESYEQTIMLIAYGYADPSGLAPASPKRVLGGVRVYRELV